MTTPGNKTDSPRAAESSCKGEQAAERLVRDAGSIGRTWAAYGLNVGCNKLEVTAQTLHKTARVLADIREQLMGKRAVQEPISPPESPKPKA